MNDRFEQLARRKQALVNQCALDREQLAAVCNRIRLPLNLGGLLLGAGKLLRTHPLLAAALSSLLISGYGRKLKRSARSLLRVGNTLRPLWSWWASGHRGK